MLKFIQLFGQFQQLQGNFSTLPRWARLIVLIFALPALAVAALSIALLGVSILALLLLTVPVYRLLSAVAGRKTQAHDDAIWVESHDVQTVVSNVEPGVTSRRHIEVKIVE